MSGETKCTYCPIRKGCDWLSEMCRLTPREIVVFRPDLIRPLTKQQRFYRANKDTLKVKYRESNNASSRKYRANNRAKRLKTERQWRARHKDQINQRRREKRAAVVSSQ